MAQASKHEHEHDDTIPADDPRAQALVQQPQPRSPEETRALYDEPDPAGPVTTQTDQLVRSAKMEKMGPTAYMEEENRRIMERQGEPPPEPRQVHGVAPVQKHR
jgi:hypothetical protein